MYKSPKRVFFKFLKRRQKFLFYTKADVEMTTANRAEILLKNT